MGTERLVELEPLVRDLFEKFVEDGDFCLTLEIAQSDVWVQVTVDALNLYWPFDEGAAKELEGELQRRFPVCGLLDLKEGQYATYSVELPPVTETALAITWLFEEIYNVKDNYSLDAEMMIL